MKTLSTYITESNMVSVDGMHFDMDKGIKWDRPNYRHIKDMPLDDWKSQGVKYVLAWPPHRSKNGSEMDKFSVTMFIKSKRLYNVYVGNEQQALINVESGKIENIDHIRMETATYKVLGLE